MSKRTKRNPQYGRHDMPLLDDSILRLRCFKYKSIDMLEIKKWVPDRLRGLRPDLSAPLWLPLAMVETFINLLREVAGGGQQH